MSNRYLAAAAAFAITAAASGVAQAEQFTASSDIFTATDLGASYVGGYTGYEGVVSDGGNDAFDTFGYLDGYSDLTVSRQTELLSGQNTYRFLDSFTNNTASSITANIQFYGNLGSDGRERLLVNEPGLIVSCQALDVDCLGDPVIAFVSGNNGLAQAALTQEDYNAYFEITVGAGQTVSLLNFAFLASDLRNGPDAVSQALAITTGRGLYAAPNTTGLSARQLAQVANYDFGVAAVPEPATWAMMILGFGAAGARLRRRRTAVA